MTSWVRWEWIAVPNGLGGWGLKNIFLFAKSLVDKGGWRLLKADSLWNQVMVHKYIAPNSMEDWFRRPMKTHSEGSVIWKVVVKSINVIESSLAWNIGNE